jgi:hypothetical protein
MSAGYVYLFRLGEFHKIGRSASPSRRATSFTSLPHDFVIVHHFFSNDASVAEKRLHSRFACQRVKGEWFRLDPADVDYVCGHRDEQPAESPVRQKMDDEGRVLKVRVASDRHARFMKTARGLGLDEQNLLSMMLAVHLPEYNDRADDNARDRAEARKPPSPE